MNSFTVILPIMIKFKRHFRNGSTSITSRRIDIGEIRVLVLFYPPTQKTTSLARGAPLHFGVIDF